MSLFSVHKKKNRRELVKKKKDLKKLAEKGGRKIKRNEDKLEVNHIFIFISSAGKGQQSMLSRRKMENRIISILFAR